LAKVMSPKTGHEKTGPVQDWADEKKVGTAKSSGLKHNPRSGDLGKRAGPLGGVHLFDRACFNIRQRNESFNRRSERIKISKKGVRRTLGQFRRGSLEVTQRGTKLGRANRGGRPRERHAC